MSSLTPQDCVGKDINVYAKTIAKRIAGPISAYIKEKFVDINNLKFDIKQFKDFLNITNE